MGVAVTIVLFVTVLIGLGVLAEFAQPKRMAAVRGAAAFVGGHLLLAAAAVVAWVAYLLGQSAGVAWLGVAAIVLTGGLGLTLYLRSKATLGEQSEVRPVPAGILVAHGVAAVLALLLGLLAAVGVGR